MDTSRYNQKGRLNFHQSVRMCMKSAIISAGEGQEKGKGAEGEREASATAAEMKFHSSGQWRRRKGHE